MAGEVRRAKQVLGFCGKLEDASQKFRRGFGAASASTGRAFCGKRIERNVDPVEAAVIGPAILQMVDDLKRGAQSVVRWPGCAAFAMHIQHEASDRIGGIACNSRISSSQFA